MIGIGITTIKLTKGKSALINTCDYPEISKYKWHWVDNGGTGYAARCINRKTIRMHRVILNASKELLVDHINGNGLDNRRDNLRLCNWSQNNRNRPLFKNNTSGSKGVTYRKDTRKYSVRISINGKYRRIGQFNSLKEAEECYKKEAGRFYGEFFK